jgi:hypothetical protein
MQATYAAHRASRRSIERDAFDWYPQWQCNAGKPCFARNRLRR